MDKFGKSQPVKRVEDVRFLTGHGRYVDDIAPKEALFAFVFRSPVAHAKVIRLNVDAARDADGVRAVLTLQDLLDGGLDIHIPTEAQPNRDGTDGAAPERPVLARDKLRHVGEAVAMVIADTLDQAKDAAELIELDYDELPAQMLCSKGEVAIHDDAPDNRALDYGRGDEEACNAAFEAAAHVVSLEVPDNRIMVCSMEPRGCYAEWQGDRLHLAVNGQGVWDQKHLLANAFGLPEDQVRVTNPDVGGGFGMKGFAYPEYHVVAFAARMLGHPVRWMSDRTEAMLSDNGGRDLVSLGELAFDKNHRITAYRVHNKFNLGAHNSEFAQAIQTTLFSRVLMGTYDVQTIWLRSEGFFTNTAPVDAYRGAGRPEAIYLLERMMDRAARELQVDPFELRKRNFIPESAFPYRTATGELYDVGEFAKLLDKAAEEADRDGLAARKAASEAKGFLRGLGLCYYIESILGDPSEGARIEFEENGYVTLYVGTQSNGQGHETVYAQFLSDQSGIPADQIRVVQGDSDLIAKGGGTGGSRSVTTQTNVTLKAVSDIVAAFSQFLASELGLDPAKVSFDDTQFRVEGSNVAPTMLEVATMALKAGREDLLRHEARERLPGRSYPNGAHIAEVEIDPETGAVAVDRYTVVDDFGNLINPMLAEGQVHGGVAQGLGQAIMERVVYDEGGQLLTASFMDYAVPRADNMPTIAFSTRAVPSTANPMGMKGCGEAGTVGALAAVANAVQDAVWDLGVRQVDMPFTPHRVWRILQDAAIGAE